MKKFFWIGKDEAQGRAAGDGTRKVEVAKAPTSPRVDAKADVKAPKPTPTKPDVKAPHVRSDGTTHAKPTHAKPTHTKVDPMAVGSRGSATIGRAAPAKPSAGKPTHGTPTHGTPTHGTPVDPRGTRVVEPEPIVPPAPRTGTREDDDTRPTRFSSAPPPPPPSSSAPVGAHDPRVVVTCLACAAKNRVPAARLADRSRCARCQHALTPVTHVITVEAESMIDAMASTSTPVLVWLGAAWSGPSSLLGLELDKLASQRAGHLLVVRIDVDHRPNLARRYLAESVPTLVLVRRGREEGREVGVLPAAALRKRFNV